MKQAYATFSAGVVVGVLLCTLVYFLFGLDGHLVDQPVADPQVAATGPAD